MGNHPVLRGLLLKFWDRQVKTNIYHRKWLYCFSKYSPWWSIHFCMRLNQFSKQFFHSEWGNSKTCVLNASTASSGVEKRWPRNLFLMCGNKKKSLGAKSGLYGGWPINSMFSVLKKSLVWADVWELALSWWKMIRLRRLVFLISPNTSGKQMVVYHSELTVRRSCKGTVVDDHLYRRNKPPFASKCFVREQLLLDLARLERPIQSTAV